MVIWRSVFHLFYRAFSVHYVISSLVGFSVAGIFGFIANKVWTFNVRKGNSSKQLLRYIILVGFSFIASGLVIYILTDLIHIKADLSQLITMVVTAMINFLGCKCWVFRARLC